MATVGPIKSWNPGQGPVTTWTASPQSRQAMQHAPHDPLPASFQQAQHLQAASLGRTLGRDLPRLLVVAWDVPGVCDVATMTDVINTHLRRHDTYHSAFDVRAGQIIRRTIADSDQIAFRPTQVGFLDADQIRTHALTTTPGTLSWDCFTFGVIQKPDHFTVYASVDHLHIDGTSAATIFYDIHVMYQALTHNLPSPLPPTVGYRAFTSRQQEQLAAVTLDSPEVRGWIDFANDGEWPSFPLPLGDTWSSSRGAFVTVELLDADETEAFDTACRAAGARFSGGVMAAAALAEHHLTGTDTFHGFTPSDTRAAESEAMSIGWYASLFPVTVPVGDGDFSDAARVAQASFDANRALAAVPLQRVLELAAAGDISLPMPSEPPMMVSFMDFRKMPIAPLFECTGFGTYGDNLSLGGVNVWVTRHATRTTLTVSYPDNDQARHSVHRYIAALSSTFAGAAAITADWIEELAHHANSSSRCAVCTGTR